MASLDSVRSDLSGPSSAVDDIYQALLRQHGSQGWWPGRSAFEVMLGAILTQNTAWRNAELALARLARRYRLTPEVLLSLPHATLARCLRSAGYYNVKAVRIKALCVWLRDVGGIESLAKLSTDELRSALLAVHGIGPETADDILVYAFNRAVFVVDAYARRLFNRLGLVRGDEPYEQIQSRLQNELADQPGIYNEYHALIVEHGKQVCKSTPRCGECSLTQYCAHASRSQRP